MSEEKHTLLSAIHEIQDLRRRNEILSAKVEVMDLFALVFTTKPNYPTHGMSEDIAWRMQKRVDEIEQAERNRPHAA